MLGSVGEDVYIEKDSTVMEKIFISDLIFLANYNLTILDIVEVKIGDYVLMDQIH